MAITAYGYSIGQAQIFFTIAYVLLIVSLFFLERFMPHEKKWQESDGQLWTDIAHTLTSKGTIYTLMAVNALIGFSDMFAHSAPVGFNLWPHHWPIAAQIILAMVASEFMLYWAHRSAHEFMPLWRFHAIHHSAKKLWIVNTGRFHIIDSLYKIVLGSIPLLLLGAPFEMFKWLGSVTAYIGIMTHCNVEMRFGVLSWVFNTPALHRWHHSKVLREGNKNYSENIMVWDIVFRTYFSEKTRRTPANIGIHEYMPPKFIQQLIWPFLSKERQKEIQEANLRAAQENTLPQDIPQAAE